MPLRVSGRISTWENRCALMCSRKSKRSWRATSTGKISGHVVILARRFGLSLRLLAASQPGVDSPCRGAKPKSPIRASSRGSTRSNAACGATRPASEQARAPNVEGSQTTIEVSDYKIEAPDDHDGGDGGLPSRWIVAEGSHRLKSLSVASAVAKLDLSGAPFLVFQHAGNTRVNVVFDAPTARSAGSIRTSAFAGLPFSAGALQDGTDRTSSRPTQFFFDPTASMARNKRCRK